MARAIPLAVLVAVVAVAIVIHVAGFGGRARAPAVASAASSSPAAASVGSSSADVPGLGAPPPNASASAAVAERGPRMIHEDAHHTHRARGHAPREAKVAWTYDTRGGMESQVTASPDEQTLYAASLDGSVTALGRDGTKKWSVPLGDRVYGTPTVADDGTIYVGTDAHAFVALSPEGRVRWRLETDGEADSGAVVTKEGLAIFAAGATVYAVRAGGDVAWRFKAKRKVFTSPALADDGTVLFGAQDDHLYALGANGALAWSIDLGADVDGSPALGDDGAVFVGTDADEVVRIEGGAVKWRTNVGGHVRGPLSVARNGDVLAGVFGPSPREVRLVAESGALRGAFPVAGTGARELGISGGALEDADGALLFGAQDDAVYAVEPTGAIRWRLPVAGDVDAPVTLLSDGSVVIASDVGDGEAGRVYLLSP